MKHVVIYHNPKCSKSRQALEFLRTNHIEATIIEYLKTPLNKKDIQSLLMLLKINVDDILRSSEDIYKTLNLKNASNTQKLDAVVAHPNLLQRPIVVFENKAIIARPPELLKDFLQLGR